MTYNEDGDCHTLNFHMLKKELDMALSTKCPKCDSTSFELDMKTKVSGSTHQFYFVRCSSCGCAISAMNYREHLLIDEMARKMGIS